MTSFVARCSTTVAYGVFIFVLVFSNLAHAQPASAIQPSTSKPWQVLTLGATDKKLERRQSALSALATLGSSPKAISMVEAGLHDKSADVRIAAAAALGEMNARDSISSLRGALDDPSAEVQFVAAKSLWKLGDHRGRAVLVNVLQGETSPSEGVIKQSWQDAKKKVNSPKAMALTGINAASGAFLGPFAMGVTLAEEFTKDKSASARALSASLLASDQDPASLRQLQYALQDKSPLVQAAAAKALGDHACSQVLPDLQTLMLEGKDEVKYMAAASILRIEGRSRQRKDNCGRLSPEPMLARRSHAPDKAVSQQQIAEK